MQQLVAEDYAINRSVLTRDAAVKFFRDQGENYKAEIIESIPADQDLSFISKASLLICVVAPMCPVPAN